VSRLGTINRLLAGVRRAGWAPLSTGLLFVLVFAATLLPSADGDLWWHLAAGRRMVETRAFLTVDPFTLSALGRPWIDLHWLFQLAVYGLHSVAGLGGVVVGKAALVAAAAVVLAAAVRRGAARDGAGAVAVAGPLLLVTLGAAIFVARHLVLVRPVVFTLLFLALFLWILEGYAQDGDRRRLWLLPLLQIVWVNSQGLFALGPAVIACYAVGGALAAAVGAPELPTRGVRTLAAVIGLCLVACLVTPYGFSGLALPVKLLLRLAPSDANVFSANIAENVPPWSLQRTQPGLVAAFSVALAVVGFSFLVARKTVVFGRGLLVLAFTALALLANRNLLLFYWVAAPMVVLNFAPALFRARERLIAHTPRARALFPAGAAASFFTLVAFVALAHKHETPIDAPAPFRVPAAALAHLPPAPADRPARVFAADHYGGYVTWMRGPHFMPYIDTRLVLHTGDEYAEFLGLLDHPERFDAFDRREKFDHVLIPAAFPDRYLGLIGHLARSPDWRLVFTDGTEVLFSRGAGSRLQLDDEASRAEVLRALEARLPVVSAAGRAARLHLARLYLVLGLPDGTREVAATLPDDLAAALLLGRGYLFAGDFARAAATAEAALAQAGEDPAVLTLLAEVALAAGDTPKALAWLRRALAADPLDEAAGALLERLEEEQRRLTAGQKSAPAPP
jgi:Tetratricopeptide repeat